MAKQVVQYSVNGPGGPWITAPSYIKDNFQLPPALDAQQRLKVLFRVHDEPDVKQGDIWEGETVACQVVSERLVNTRVDGGEYYSRVVRATRRGNGSVYHAILSEATIDKNMTRARKSN